MIPTYTPVPGAPPEWDSAWATRIVAAVNLLLGKLSNTADLTLDANATMTAFSHPRLSVASTLVFMPLTANAATAKGTIYVTDQNNGVATINHANTADTDKTFRVFING